MKVSYTQLSDLTGMTYRTIKKRLDSANLKPAGQAEGPGGANLWESKDALRAIYAPVAGDRLDPGQERALLDREKRKTQEMKNKELKGQLIDAERVSELWARIIVAAKTKILSIKSECAPLVRELVIDSEDCEMILSAIDDRCREALNELSEYESK